MDIRKRLSTTLFKASRWLSEEARKEGRKSLAATDFTRYSLERDQDVQSSNADRRDYLEAYQALYWVFVGVRNIADSCAVLPRRIINRTSLEDVPDHPVLKLFNNPNNLLQGFELFQKAFGYHCLVGDAYFCIDREEDDPNPEKLHVPRPDRMTSKPLKSDTITYVRARTNGELEDWSMKDIVHFTSFNPLSDFQGFGQAQAAQQALILDLYQHTFGKRFFQNAVMPSLVFASPELLDEEAYERMVVELNRLHVGVDKFFNVALLEGGIQPVDIKRTSPQDANFQEMKGMTRDEILTTMGCYHLIPLLKGETRAAIELAYRMFYEITLMPLLENFAQTIDKELLSQYQDGDKVKFNFDLRNAPGLRENVLDQSQADYRYVITGIKTINELRRERGFGKPIDWGDDPPPTVVSPRSRMSPNEFRAFEENQFAHPERYVGEEADDDLKDSMKSEMRRRQISSN